MRHEMIPISDETRLAHDALAYVSALFRELSQENGAANLGTQNQAIDFILADPQLRAAVARWGRAAQTEEEDLAPPARLPRDDAYRRVRTYVEAAMAQPFFAARGREQG